MTKINQIQNKLLELGGGAFQKLADAYLHKKGYERINPLGSVIGADKVRKGTPDALVSLPNGKYVFAEYTTTEKRKMCDKLKGDLDKCFDVQKTGIPLEKIQEVVFCHTSTLEAAEENALAEECQRKGVNLNIFGIGPISYDLYQKYHGLARDFLGITVDTGQIIPPDEFIAIYNKNALATPLDTSFHFRDEEVDIVLQNLNEGDLVIVTGRAGVGKSRLALECCEQFTVIHPEYRVLCVHNRGPDLFEDLRVHLSESGYYLVLVDDANRVSRFEYVVQLLQSQREDQHIKVIATVRDYALDTVREAAQFYKDRTEIEIHPLKEKQLKQLVEEEYDIRNHHYLDRIAEIAQGNPRLAIMAAEVARREDTLKSISDVSSLYDDYFASIRHDLKELDEQTLLKAAGIVTFFRVVDRSNVETMQSIENAFDISPETFWEAACRLHELEVFDMYEDEVVRASDQVLATYLFYLVFFRERTLDFSILLEYFFPRFRSHLVDALNPALVAFDSKGLIEIMRPSVDEAWKEIKKVGDEKALFDFIEVFWYLKETDVLLYIQRRVAAMEPDEVDLSSINFKPDQNVRSHSFLNVLSLFRYSDDGNCRIALNILLDYVTKRPRELPQVLFILTDRFGFKHISYLRGFSIQRVVIDVLWDRTQEGKELMLSTLFLAVAEQYLHTHFHTSESKGRDSVQLINFDVPPTPELLRLRETIWTHTLSLYQNQSLTESICQLLHMYTQFARQIKSDKILELDARQLLPFIASEFDSTSFHNCSMVQKYLNFLEECQLTFDSRLREQFRNDTVSLSEILLSDWSEQRNRDLSYDEFNKLKQEQIERHFIDYDFSDYKTFLKQCREIDDWSDQNPNDNQFQSAVIGVLLTLANRDLGLYARVMEHYLATGDSLKLYSKALARNLIDAWGVERAYKIFNQSEYPTKRRWLFCFYSAIPSKELRVEHLKQLYDLYQEAQLEEMPFHLDFLLAYRTVDKEVVVKITEFVLTKVQSEPKFASALTMLFNPGTEINKLIVEIFVTDLDLLKRAYFSVMSLDRHIDYSGQTFNRILDIDANFILEYIDHIYESKDWISRYNDRRDYSFLWMRDDYETLMIKVIERIYDWEGRSRFSYGYLETFFLKLSGNYGEAVEKRQNLLLQQLVEHLHASNDFIVCIFGVIAQFSPERRRPFIVTFLKYNQKFEDFRRLPLEPSSGSWWGSAVPMLQGRIEYFESLLPILNTVELLPHKQFVEQIITRLREEIEREKKWDFMGA